MSQAEKSPYEERPRHLAPLPSLPPGVIPLAETIIDGEAGLGRPLLNKFCMGGFVELTGEGEVVLDPTIDL